ncbi:CRAL-TRIO domain-containing protein [Dunaliella salina]|uniref:CRAL-TRIO domain-containing protein n=1 Tax=Dunaliella salina TaxID=3046 RepID=A0ABQ7GXJ0_DUNSA|nr:CRAL-TRIO domain-containing protein [Dunaliella salina]|eukprot:KAF5839314.1 CRAL-TRIO domain-containing protein [Dunaliella salina]
MHAHVTKGVAGASRSAGLLRQPCKLIPPSCKPRCLCQPPRASSEQATRVEVPGLKPEPWLGSPEQLAALSDLRQRMVQNSGPRGQSLDDRTLRWYLRDRSFDVDEAEQKLQALLRWKEVLRPETLTYERVAEEYATGKVYTTQQLDKFGRPAIVVRCKLHRIGEFPLADSQALAAFMLDQAVRTAEDLGQEQIVGIFDLRGFNVQKNADFTFARFLIDLFFEIHPKRVGQVLFVDAPWAFKPAWAIIQPLMRKYAALVRFVSVAELQNEYFTPDTVPPDFAETTLDTSS